MSYVTNINCQPPCHTISVLVWQREGGGVGVQLLLGKGVKWRGVYSIVYQLDPKEKKWFDRTVGLEFRYDMVESSIFRCIVHPFIAGHSSFLYNK